MFLSKPCHQIRICCVLFILAAGTSAVYAADSAPAFDSEVASISALLQQKGLLQAQTSMDQFWTEHSSDEGFLEAVRQIKDVIWQEADHAAHYALCDRIIKAFPNDTLAVVTRADVVRGYIYDKDLTKAAEKLEEFWTYGKSDERFLEYARQIKDLYWEKKEYTAHYALCGRIIKEFPNDTLAVATSADIVRGYIYNQNLEKAAEKLEEFWTYGKSDEHFLEYTRQIKDLYWEKKEFSAHFSLCDRIINEFPDHPLAVSTQADVVRGYVYNKDLVTAAVKLEEFLSKSSDSAIFREAVHEVGQAYRWEGKNPAKGREIYNLWLDKYSSDPKAYILQCAVVLTYLEEDDIAGANTALERFKQLCAGREDVDHETSYLVEKYSEKKQIDNAIELAQWYIDQRPDYDNVIAYRDTIVRLYLIAGQIEAARTAFSGMTAFKDNPEYVSRIHELGDKFADQKDYSTALQIFIDLKKQYPNHERAAWFQRSIVQTYLDLDDNAGVDREVDLFFSQYLDCPGFREQARQMASDFNKHDEIDKVLEIYSRLLHAFPEHEQAIQFHAGLIKTLLIKGDTNQAEMLIDTLASEYQTHPDYAEVVNDLGNSYRSQKAYAKAINVYRKTLAAESPQEDILTAYTGIARAAVWLEDSTINPNSYEVYETDPNTATITETDPNSPSANDRIIDSIIQRLMAYYEQTQRQDYRVCEIAEDYYFKGLNAKSVGNSQQLQADMTRAIEVWEKNITPYADSGYQYHVNSFIGNAYQDIESYEDAIKYYRKVLNQWPQFDQNWFIQYKIIQCYDRSYINGKRTNQEDTKLKVINECREYEERYPQSNVIEIVRAIRTNYGAK